MTTDTKDGGPAFPQTCADALDIGMVHTGMSLRDYYAGLALQSLTAALAHHIMVEQAAGTAQIALNNTARFAFAIADAMLKVRDNG